jgi:hypothetical protein
VFHRFHHVGIEVIKKRVVIVEAFSRRHGFILLFESLPESNLLLISCCLDSAPAKAAR